MLLMRKLILLAGCLLCFAAHAEIYMGLQPETTLGEIKKRFPNATVTKVDAAWVTESDGFYRMTGAGLTGMIYLAFKDNRPSYRKQIPSFEQKIEALRAEAQTDATKSTLETLSIVLDGSRKLEAETTDQALKLKWVRWVPPTPIPVARYLTKYGPPTKSGFNDDDMQPFNSWPAKGVSLNLTDDGKSVLNAEFGFTAKETRDQCMAKYKFAEACN